MIPPDKNFARQTNFYAEQKEKAAHISPCGKMYAAFVSKNKTINQFFAAPTIDIMKFLIISTILRIAEMSLLSSSSVLPV